MFYHDVNHFLFFRNGLDISKEEDHPVYIRAQKFIYDEFMSGEETGWKTSAEKVVTKMRVLREESGKKFSYQRITCQ